MAYQDIEAWEAMDKAALYQELVRLYGADVPPIDDITHIYVDNCYELCAEVGGFARNYFISLRPSEPTQYRRVDLEESIFPGDVYAWRKPGPYEIGPRFSS